LPWPDGLIVPVSVQPRSGGWVGGTAPAALGGANAPVPGRFLLTGDILAFEAFEHTCDVAITTSLPERPAHPIVERNNRNKGKHVDTDARFC